MKKLLYIVLPLSILHACNNHSQRRLVDQQPKLVSFYDEIRQAVRAHIDSSICLHNYIYPDSVLIASVIFENTKHSHVAMVFGTPFYCAEENFIGYTSSETELIGYAWSNKSGTEIIDTLLRDYVNPDWIQYNNLVQSPRYSLHINLDGIDVSVYDVDSLYRLNFLGRKFTRKAIEIKNLRDK